MSETYFLYVERISEGSNEVDESFKVIGLLVLIAAEIHLIPFRPQKLSPPAAMVLQGFPVEE